VRERLRAISRCIGLTTGARPMQRKLSILLPGIFSISSFSFGPQLMSF
jgi:hypothetical protein